MNKENKVTLVSNIILVGFFLAVIFHYVLGFYMGMKPPFNSFVYPAYKAFCDFKDVLPFVQNLAPYKEVTPWIAYFPLAYIFMFPFTLIKSKVIAYLIFASGFMAFLIYMDIKVFSGKSLTKLQNFQNIFIITFLSYPVLFNLDKGNFDMFLFIVLALSVYCFKSEKYLLSAILLAIENAIKPFPLLFLLLFLFKKRYKEFFLSLILTGLLIIGGFMVLRGDFFNQIVVFIQDLELFKLGYVYGNDNNMGLNFTSSLFMPLKWAFCKLGSHPAMSPFLFERIYNWLWNIITVIIVFFTWKEKIFWKRISLLTFYMLLMPYLVFDYKLIFLFIPLWLFAEVKESSRFDLIYTILFGLLLIPKSAIIINPLYIKNPDIIYFLMSTPHSWSQIGISVILNPLIMILFIGLIITEQFLKEKDKNNG
ncbi:MAG: glycosyltransferase 87 family protein [Candidatus Gastranaerophilaceae bacterium]